MFNLNSSSFSGSVPWNTNYAREFLRISKEQLEKLNQIPGWSKTATLENIDKQLTQQNTTSKQSILTVHTNISSTNTEPSKNQKSNSDLYSNQKYNSKKADFLKKLPLSLEENNTLACPLKRSSSLPNLYQELLSYKEPELCRKRVHSLEKNLSSKTHTVPLTSDGINHDKLLGINKSFSCPFEQSNQLLKPKLLKKTLDDNILNHKYLKGDESSDFNSVPRFSHFAVQSALKKKMSQYEKKFLLLEKRFSPSKEVSPLPTNAKLKKLNCEKNLQSAVLANEVAVAVISSDSEENLQGKVQNSTLLKSPEFLESQVNSETLNKESDVFESNKNNSVTTINNFESFLSPPIPCGQPVPTEVHSPNKPFSSQKLSKMNTSLPENFSSPTVPSQELAKLNTLNKLQAAILLASGEHLSKKLSSETHAVSSEKLAKLSIPSKSQKADVFSNTIPEKSSDTVSVFSVSSNEKISDLTTSKELGTKRKRRNKSERSSKKLDVKKIKQLNIQFSSSQIKSMIEIMKILHT